MNIFDSLLKVFESRKMAIVLAMGFASGLPLFLTSRTLQAWMTAEGVGVATIGLFSVVALPYSCKFLWSPIMDRYVPPFLGRRRGWLLLTQVALAAVLGVMALQSPRALVTLSASSSEACSAVLPWFQGFCQLFQTMGQLSSSGFFWAALAIAFLSASQDINVDAYRTDVLEEREMGAGVALYVLGYRIALLVTGSLAFILADRLSWPVVYLILAALMLANVGFTLWAPEPPAAAGKPATLLDAVWRPFQDFIQRLGLGKGILILVFVVLYKYGDSLVNAMATPFLLQAGFSQTDIGAIQGGMGLAATLVGTLAGGAILSKIGITRSLWVFGGLQALSNIAYLVLANGGNSYPLMVVAINVENFCGGLGTAGFVAFLMSLCNPQFSATQYALLSSFMAVSRDLLVTPAGIWAESLGWPLFFTVTLLAAVPALVMLPLFAPWNPSPSMARPGRDSD
nr:AmpG family muropeptide MFS transporter [Prochlorothrix hollandica]